jgi:hypothetical protein
MPQLLEPALDIDDRVDAADTVIQVHLGHWNHSAQLESLA